MAEDVVDRIQEAWRRERPGAPVGAMGVLTRIRLIAKLLNDDHRRAMAELGIDSATRDLLSSLRRAGAPYRATPSELARSTLISAGAVSQRLARAERDGFIRRQRSRDDGRVVFVELTAAGHELIERTVDTLLAHEEELLRALDGEQRDQLATLLRTLLLDLGSR
jgi:DNA-binding MarR family transcriptional regulator